MKRWLLLFVFAFACSAHVGSPDIYLEGNAGPYRLFVTIRVPEVIPGVAEVDVRSEAAGVTGIQAVPIPIEGAGAKFAPVADKLAVSKQDQQFYTGALWMMESGSWQIRLSVKGDKGPATLSVPVPSVAQSTKKMQRGLGAALSVMMVVLVSGLVAIVGASVREVKLEPGVRVNAPGTRRGRIAMAVAAVVVVAILWFGKGWWDSEAAEYGQRVYKPLQMNASLDASSVLALRMSDPGWRPDGLLPRKLDDLVTDHNHLMHLYAIRQPGLDVVYHLHPDQTEAGVFRIALPSMLQGHYGLYADVVHANGFPETLVGALDLPSLQGRPLEGDDAFGSAKGSASAAAFVLPDSYRMEWVHEAAPISARAPTLFRFRLEDPQGRAPADMQLYMGMLGHAAFVKTDGSVFAHIHPSGSVSMAALMLLQPKTPSEMQMHSGMNMDTGTTSIPNEVSFPYGLPKPGSYRIFVQMKHGTTVETGIFDVNAI